jgi:hypothetical protein
MTDNWEHPVGRILRSSTAGFSAGARSESLDIPAFGQVVKVEPQDEYREVLYGILYDIHIDDDPMVRQLVLADTVSEEMVRDQRRHRIMPIEMSVICIGYLEQDGTVRHALPPRPPLSLDPLYICSPGEAQAVTARFDYFRIVLGNGNVPSEQLLAANVLNVSRMLPEEDQYPYLVAAGRELARLLSGDLNRLDNVLRLIYPYVEQ